MLLTLLLVYLWERATLTDIFVNFNSSATQAELALHYHQIPVKIKKNKRNTLIFNVKSLYLDFEKSSADNFGEKSKHSDHFSAYVFCHIKRQFPV